MGRALGQTELCAAAAPASPGLAESLLVGLDYREESASTATPAASTQGNGNVAFGGCHLGLGGQNVCAVSPPVITN